MGNYAAKPYPYPSMRHGGGIMQIQKMHKWAYIIMAVMTAVLVVLNVYFTISGNNEIYKSALIYIIFGVYFVVQLVCLFFVRPGLSIYKVGFYLLHAGILIMLIGFFLGAVFGKMLPTYVPVDPAGNAHGGMYDKDGEFVDFGFGFKFTDFKAEFYDEERTSPSYYGAKVAVYETSDRTGVTYQADTVMLEVNHTFRNHGFKMYLMEYTDGSFSGDGSYLLPAETAVQEIITNNGGAAVVAEILGNSEYSGADIYYYLFDPGYSGYSSVGTNAAALSAMSGQVTARIYKGEDGAFCVYAAQTAVKVLIKYDPGEYFVISGMIAVMIGVVMMCLIRGRSKGDTAPDRNTARRSAKGGAKK